MTPTSSKNTRLTHSAFAALIITLSATATVSAHPGHGIASDGDSAIHYLVEPTHGIGLGIIALSTIAATIVLWRRNRQFRNQSAV
jgi:tellurite resistance protein TehA-like permease